MQNRSGRRAAFSALTLAAITSLVCLRTATGTPELARSAAAADVATAEATTPRASRSAAQSGRLSLGGGRFVRFVSDASLERGDATAEQAVVIVHGTFRNAETYHRALLGAVSAGDPAGRTLLVAPSFRAASDDHEPGELYWRDSSGWKQGDDASDSSGRPLGSFDVLDAMVTRLSDRARFPRLRRVVIAGHSAGGQLVQRYAAASHLELSPDAPALRYVVASPSSYVYLDGRRPANGSPVGFAIPKASCEDYDRWRYGLERPNRYARATGVERMRETYATRDVVYLIGAADDDPEDRTLDKGCAARLQGRDRVERAVHFARYAGELFGARKHRLAVAPGVDHSARALFASEQGMQALFGDFGESLLPRPSLVPASETSAD